MVLRVNNLNGFGARAGVSVLTEVATVLSAVGVGNQITIPGGVIAGDLLVMHDVGSGSPSPPSAVLDGAFTQLANVTTTALRAISSYRVASGAEAGVTINGMSPGASGGGATKVMQVFRGNIPISAATPASGNSQGTTGNPGSQLVTAGGGTPPLVVLGFYAAMNTNASIDPRTFSPAKDGELRQEDHSVTFDVDNWLAWKIYNSAPANVTIDMDDEGNNILQSVYLQLT